MSISIIVNIEQTSLERDENLNNCSQTETMKWYKIKKTCDFMRADKRLIIREQSSYATILFCTTYHAILIKHLGMRVVTTKFALWVLTTKNYKDGLSTATDLLLCAGLNANFSKKIITSDKMWESSCKHEIKVQSLVWIFILKPNKFSVTVGMWWPHYTPLFGASSLHD